MSLPVIYRKIREAARSLSVTDSSISAERNPLSTLAMSNPIQVYATRQQQVADGSQLISDYLLGVDNQVEAGTDIAPAVVNVFVRSDDVRSFRVSLPEYLYEKPKPAAAHALMSVLNNERLHLISQEVNDTKMFEFQIAQLKHQLTGVQVSKVLFGIAVACAAIVNNPNVTLSSRALNELSLVQSATLSALLTLSGETTDPNITASLVALALDRLLKTCGGTVPAAFDAIPVVLATELGQIAALSYQMAIICCEGIPSTGSVVVDVMKALFTSRRGLTCTFFISGYSPVRSSPQQIQGNSGPRPGLSAMPVGSVDLTENAWNTLLYNTATGSTPDSYNTAFGILQGSTDLLRMKKYGIVLGMYSRILNMLRSETAESALCTYDAIDMADIIRAFLFTFLDRPRFIQITLPEVGELVLPVSGRLNECYELARSVCVINSYAMSGVFNAPISESSKPLYCALALLNHLTKMKPVVSTLSDYSNTAYTIHGPAAVDVARDFEDLTGILLKDRIAKETIFTNILQGSIPAMCARILGAISVMGSDSSVVSVLNDIAAVQLYRSLDIPYDPSKKCVERLVSEGFIPVIPNYIDVTVHDGTNVLKFDAVVNSNIAKLSDVDMTALHIQGYNLSIGCVVAVADRFQVGGRVVTRFVRRKANLPIRGSATCASFQASGMDLIESTMDDKLRPVTSSTLLHLSPPSHALPNPPIVGRVVPTQYVPPAAARQVVYPPRPVVQTQQHSGMHSLPPVVQQQHPGMHSLPPVAQQQLPPVVGGLSHSSMHHITPGSMTTNLGF